MVINDRGLELIQEFEGFREHAYQDSGGVWTVGWGSTRMDGRPVRRGDTVSLSKADAMLHEDLRKFKIAVHAAICVPMTSNQFSALMSLCYNIGPGAFTRSTLRKKFNAGDVAGAANEFLKWNKVKDAGKMRVSKGLKRRREAERALFLTEDGRSVGAA